MLKLASGGCLISLNCAFGNIVCYTSLRDNHPCRETCFTLKLPGHSIEI